MGTRNTDWLGRARLGFAAALVAVLAACGGGDGGSASSGFTDSFGRPVSADAGFAPGDAGIDGTAAEGAPIVGGTVTVTDMGGKSATATTDAQGYYRVEVTGFTAPFLVRVTTSSGRVYHSVNVRPAAADAFLTVNISGLTDKVASDLARAAGLSGASQLTPQAIAAQQGTITVSLGALRTQLATLITNAGLDAASFDPLTVPFLANHTGYDYVLDRLVFSIGGDGATVVTVSPPSTGGSTGGSTGALAGNWELSVTMDGMTSVLGVVPAEAVPSAEDLAQLNSAIVGEQMAEAYGSYTATISGSTVTITGPTTSFSMTIDNFTIGGYTGCGTCGVGSTVGYSMSVTTTQGGTLEGQVVPTSTVTVNQAFSYRRVN